MSEADKKQTKFVPQLDAVLEALADEADEVEGWAEGLGIELTYTDPVLDEQGENEWAGQLRQSTDWSRRTAVSLLTVQGKTHLVDDLERRVEALYSVADAFEARLEALADQRRVHIEGIVARYRKLHGDGDPELAGLACAVATATSMYTVSTRIHPNPWPKTSTWHGLRRREAS